MKEKLGIAAVLGYIATIFAANWAINRYGVVPVGFGLMAPAGVYFAGLAFSLRDGVQETVGKRAVIAAILVGSVLSLFLGNTKIAVASATAFLVSELADFLVYSRLRRTSQAMWVRPDGKVFPSRVQGNWTVAVGASNIVGSVIDSAIFLTIAFSSLEFLPGQVVGKFWSTAVVVALIAAVRAVLSRRP